MLERKREIMELAKKRGIDLVKLEKELISMLRKGNSAFDIKSYVESYIRRLLEVRKH
jgi:urocanate hydratase